MIQRIAGIIALIISMPMAAQWIDYPTPGVPLTKDGKPNLFAPAPRAADGKPSLAGIWLLDATGCGPAGCADYVPGPEFLDMGAKLNGGLPYQPWAADIVKKRAADLGKDDPVGMCMPAGAVRLLTFPPPRKILQLPGLLVILSERDVTYRQIFTDGRPLPIDPTPSFNGYSSGKWDGSTLVVRTNGFRDGIWIDRKGSFMTEAAQLTERFRRVDYGHLEIELTLDDPKAYTRPWTVTLKQTLLLNTELLDYHCMENEKDAGHLVGK